MSNDNKPLADVQPGGRVRLGDALTTRRFIAERTTNPEYRQDVLDGDYDGTEWFAHVQAALSAQPSPGGQGDALPPLPPKDVVDTHLPTGVQIYGYTAEQMQGYARAARQPVGEVSVKKEDANNYCLILRALGMEEEGDPVAEVKALIEARDRQPVGEIVIGSDVLIDGRKAKVIGFDPYTPRLQIEWADAAGRKEYRPREQMALAAPPAQAVDLGGLREILESWKNSDYPFSYEGQCAQRALDACIADLKRWLDSQAVGNG